jgi:DNA polymerase III subunit gamma/tau
MAWYNKYRPEEFSEVIGQRLVKEVLMKTVEKRIFKHAYLFNGPKGTGKTTLARIFANNINQIKTNPEATFDIVELDAASNTGIDDIRSLIESSKNPPVAGEFKIYIIDEVHMLSKNAMNALLKILEEPPIYLIFLLATTNPEKLIPTILSRVTKLNLFAHSITDLVLNLEKICKSENLNFTPEALKLIAQKSDGAQRDAINLVETIASYGLEIYDIQKVSEILGIANNELIEELIANAFKSEVDSKFIKNLEKSGIEGISLLNQTLNFCLNKSLYENETQFDEIIKVIAEILSLDIALNEAIIAFAILQSRLRLANPVQFKYTKTNVQEVKEQVVKSKPIPEIKPIITESLPKTEISSSSHDEEKTYQNNEIPKQIIENSSKIEDLTTEDQILPTNPFDLNKEEINQYFQSLSKDKILPITLKLLSMDIQAEELTQENDGNLKLTVSVSNGVYLAQLNSEKNRIAFEKLLIENFGNKISLTPVQRKGGIKKEIETEYTPFTTPEEVQFVGKGDKSSENKENNENKIDQNQPTNTQEADSNTTEGIQTKNLFYKVYKNKKPNMENVEVEIRSEKIEKPSQNAEKGETENTQSWEDHIDEFDFE